MASPRLTSLALHRPSILAGIGSTADEWQADVLTAERGRLLLNCCRQSGKSTTTAGLAVVRAVLDPGSTILVVSPSQRQAAELLARARPMLMWTGARITKSSVLTIELANGSRIIALPGTERTVRGYTADLVIIDEAARVLDELYEAVRPMLATTKGQLLALSTPWGERGWWYDAWANGGAEWHRIEVPATSCARISAEFLASERRSLPAAVFAAEYECSFQGLGAGVFGASDELSAALSPDVAPLWLPSALSA